ncbi:hypothetical protein [Natronoglycomyces albus]|uniref:Lipoprotein n=1 Tax=Natronoglycomyces albus TaxID=2811108 RepID=A0A895XYD0_9ACTN|nr:hypothetical protein [Natronoglycomyces albus]QSB07190.1 hypothetical protein JQS30_16940 [Natronoglycomyces albus]
MITVRSCFALLVVVVLSGCSSGSFDSDVREVPTASATSEGPSLHGDHDHDHSDPSTEEAPPIDEGAGVVEAFAAALGAGDRDAGSWHEDVSQWCTEYLADLYSHTDPALIPFDSVEGDAKLTDPPAGQEAGEARQWWSVATNEKLLVVELVAVDGRWLVHGTNLGDWRFHD